jgi:enoyl-CoA hydratase/carnithine racemase
MTATPVIVRLDGPVATVCLNAPPLNLLNAPLYEALDAAFRAVVEDEALRAIVLTGAGERAFSAGADVKEFGRRQADPSAWRRDLTRIHEIFTAIERCPKPTVAALNGLAYGGGLELALTCDLRIAAGATRLALPEITLGEFPATGGTQRLPRLIGLARARSFMLLGEPMTAAEAHAFGLIDRVVAPGDVLPTAMAIGATLATRSGVAVAALKRALLEGMERPLIQGLALEVDLMEALCRSFDATEGYRAFLEKRPPRFTHR